MAWMHAVGCHAKQQSASTTVITNTRRPFALCADLLVPRVALRLLHVLPSTDRQRHFNKTMEMINQYSCHFSVPDWLSLTPKQNTTERIASWKQYLYFNHVQQVGSTQSSWHGHCLSCTPRAAWMHDMLVPAPTAVTAVCPIPLQLLCMGLHGIKHVVQRWNTPACQYTLAWIPWCSVVGRLR